mgnify:CR=1 FL=1
MEIKTLDPLDLGSLTPEQISRAAAFLRTAYSEYAVASDEITVMGGMMRLSRLEGRPVQSTIGGDWLCVSAPSEEDERREWHELWNSLPKNPKAYDFADIDVYPHEFGYIEDVRFVLTQPTPMREKPKQPAYVALRKSRW